MALGRTLGAVAAGLAALVAVLGVLRGQPVELMVVTAVSLIVAAVPESLPAVITLSLALGARRMAARRALIRRLPAVESLGSVTVIATDKTGTLTEGRMVAERVWTPRGEVEVSGRGYAPTGAITPVSEEAGEDRGLRRAIEDLARAGVLCNDAHLLPPEDGKDAWEALGDPTEAALLALAARAGLDRDHEVAWHPRLAEIGFDARTRRMSTLHVAPGGGRLAITKGAPDVLLVPEVCADSPAVLAAARAWAEHRSARGYRVLAVASVELPGGHADEDAGSVPESGLHLLGLVAMADPPRESARQTLTRCRQSGIRPVLITGDHPATAQAIAGRLGMVESADIHARVAPEGKLDIVRRLQAGGDVVAMTGDGVNDGPALRAADVGVAMGRRGTEVARQAADVVLADDELATIVDAVEEGRRVYANVRRFLGYGLAGGVGEIVVMLAGPFLGMAVPLRPAQILWVNLLTHGLPGVALGAEPAEPDAMRRGPRPPERSVLGDGLWQRVLRLGLLVGAISLGLAAWRHGTLGWAGDDAEAAAAQTTVFLTLGCAQFGIALGSRALHGLSGWRTNPFLLVSVAGAFALQVAGAYLPILQDLLGTTSPSVTDLWLALAALPVGYAAIRLDRAVFGGR
jgi:Ca2+-transporting ATPase